MTDTEDDEPVRSRDAPISRLYPRPVPLFQLLDEDGTDLGRVLLGPNVWNPGDRIHRGAGDALVVVRVTWAEPGDVVVGYLVVRQA